MTDLSQTHLESGSSARELLAHLRPFQKPHAWRSAQQCILNFAALGALLYAMYLSYDYSPLLTVLLGIPASIFNIRLFIVQHDCGHGSFFKSHFWNDAVGWLCSIFTSFPYSYWRHQHALHHASAGKLDQRGNGDVFLYTVREYLALSRWEKFKYRLIRHPVTMLIFGPFVLFFIMNRFAWEGKDTPWRVRAALQLSNLLTFGIIGTAMYFFGVVKVVCIVTPIIFFAGMLGTFLFYVQHQFEDTYWTSSEEWDFARAALQGSSFFDLPRFLHWCTGNIGYHHIHHLAPKIPNYSLPASHEAHPSFATAKRETLRSSLRTLFLSVWDEETRRLISFRELKQRVRALDA